MKTILDGYFEGERDTSGVVELLWKDINTKTKLQILLHELRIQVMCVKDDLPDGMTLHLEDIIKVMEGELESMSTSL